MATPVYIVARFRAKEGAHESLKEALARLVDPTRLEPGCEQYDLVQSADDPRDFCILERWTDQDSLGRHIAGEDLRRALGQASAFFDGAPQGSRFGLVR